MDFIHIIFSFSFRLSEKKYHFFLNERKHQNKSVSMPLLLEIRIHFILLRKKKNKEMKIKYRPLISYDNLLHSSVMLLWCIEKKETNAFKFLNSAEKYKISIWNWNTNEINKQPSNSLTQTSKLRFKVRGANNSKYILEL